MSRKAKENFFLLKTKQNHHDTKSLKNESLFTSSNAAESQDATQMRPMLLGSYTNS